MSGQRPTEAGVLRPGGLGSASVAATGGPRHPERDERDPTGEQQQARDEDGNPSLPELRQARPRTGRRRSRRETRRRSSPRHSTGRPAGSTGHLGPPARWTGPPRCRASPAGQRRTSGDIHVALRPRLDVRPTPRGRPPRRTPSQCPKTGALEPVGVTRIRTSPKNRSGSALSAPAVSTRTSPSTTAYPLELTTCVGTLTNPPSRRPWSAMSRAALPASPPSPLSPRTDPRTTARTRPGVHPAGQAQVLPGPERGRGLRGPRLLRDLLSAGTARGLTADRCDSS